MSLRLSALPGSAILKSRSEGEGAVAGHAVCDGGLMIDLSLMKAIRIDSEARTARAAGGVLWSEFDRATQQYALATTGGIISHTGIGGLTSAAGSATSCGSMVSPWTTCSRSIW